MNRFLESLGVELHKSASLKNEKGFFQDTIDRIANFHVQSLVSSFPDINKGISSIVFSKDRAMQLHALLSSYFYYTKNPAPLIILFRCSDKEHEISYEELQNEFKSFPVSFVKEVDFALQLKGVVGNLTSDRLFFMTDDAIFLDSYDLNDCLHYHPIENLFSLRLGTDLDFCYAYNKKQSLPDFKQDELNETVHIWKWSNRPASPDWNYPLSLDATIYFRKEIALILECVAFSSPNSLESQMQLYKELFLVRNGICFSKVKYVNVPCNVVQQEFNNKSNDSFTVKELLSYFLKGQRIDWRMLEGMKAPEAQQAKFTFCKGEKQFFK